MNMYMCIWVFMYVSEWVFLRCFLVLTSLTWDKVIKCNEKIKIIVFQIMLCSASHGSQENAKE